MSTGKIRDGYRSALTVLHNKTLKPICDKGIVKRLEITSDRDGVSWLVSVSEFAKLIQIAQDDLFELRATVSGVAIAKKNHWKPVADLFITLVKSAPRYVKKTFPYHSFEPAVDLFFQMLQGKSGVPEIAHSLGHVFSTVNAMEFCKDLNGFVRQYRDTIGSEDFRALVRRRQRAARKNCQALSGLLSELFAYRSRLLVVRVDLYYPSDFAGAKMTGTTVSPDIVAQDRAAFIRRLEQSPISRHLLDFTWKLEFTERKGFHYHWLFFFDGAKVREGITLGRRLGEFWEQVIGGQNLYWNCNAQKQAYEQSGLGMILRTNIDGLNGLDRAINYLTKPDYYLALVNDKVGDTFGTWPKGKKKRRGYKKDGKFAR